MCTLWLAVQRRAAYKMYGLDYTNYADEDTSAQLAAFVRSCEGLEETVGQCASFP